MSDTPDFLTIADTARRLSMSVYTVQRWVKEGKLDHVRIGEKSIRIPAGELVRLLNQGNDKTAYSNRGTFKPAAKRTECRREELQA